DRVEGVKFGIVGGVRHPQVDYSQVAESDAPWARSADQCMVYVSCHDNHTLYDKLKIANPQASQKEILKMHVLAQTIVLASQGIPFLHAGVDFVRTKQGVENSYNAPDSINQIDWTRKDQFRDIFAFYRDLISLRKQHPLFKLSTQEEIARRLQFMDIPQVTVLAYTVDASGLSDTWDQALFIFNGGPSHEVVPVPDGVWTSVVEGKRIDDSGLRQFTKGSVGVPAHSGMILYQ
ncbi:MAG: alpha-1,6-glucosidase domain-containing protein, partial [Saprospiraceae bacterium]|nr:alpha-1,6-glucosidase domain-containing protein [Saprospiraceae bacterium]